MLNNIKISCQSNLIIVKEILNNQVQNKQDVLIF